MSAEIRLTASSAMYGVAATTTAMQLVKSTPLPSGFANATFNGLNAFRFVNASGVATPVRWSMAASDPFTPETPEQAKNPDKNYLFDDFIARVARGPVQWHLLVTIGQPSDPTSDPTLPWPAERERVDVGTLAINHGHAGPSCRTAAASYRAAG